MKKIHALIAAVVVLAAASVAVIVNAGKPDSFFEANIEALTQEEIIVGELCMVAPGYACTSLEVVYEEHYKAN